MSRESFDLELGRMAVLPGMPTDSDAYWEVLCDVPDDLFISAVGHALRTRKWFPVPVELRADVDAVKPRTYYSDRKAEARPTSFTAVIQNPLGGAPITVQVKDYIPHECEACSDTGWVSFWCGPATARMGDWMERLACDRRGPHVAHEYVRSCPCVSSNGVIQRKRDAQAQFAAQRVADGERKR